MIAKGTDGIFRGSLCDGVMAGSCMQSFIPLHLSALQRAPEALLSWLQSWIPQANITPLTLEQWFEKGHGIQGGAYNDEGYMVAQGSN
jgi:hypothetical protein